MNEMIPVPIEQCKLASALCWIPDPLPIDSEAGYWDVLHRVGDGWVSSNWQHFQPTHFIQLPFRPGTALAPTSDHGPIAELHDAPQPPRLALSTLFQPSDN